MQSRKITAVATSDLFKMQEMYAFRNWDSDVGIIIIMLIVFSFESLNSLFKI